MDTSRIPSCSRSAEADSDRSYSWGTAFPLQSSLHLPRSRAPFFGGAAEKSTTCRRRSSPSISERSLFGWGGYGRDRVVNDEDKTVTDGLWIILFGQLGALGFLSVFGLMLLPIFRCPRAVRNMSSPSDRRLLASFAFLVSLNWAD